MQGGSVLPSRAGDWVRQVKRDLQHARNDLDAAYFEWACFGAHQAAEKAVKALFQYLHGPRRPGGFQLGGC